jgi:SpoVK/Ycf46/Vps4 family AAA+-type ATPase
MHSDILAVTVKNPKTLKKASESDAIKLLPKLIQAFVWGNKERIAEIGESVAISIETYHPAISRKIREIAGHTLQPVNLTAKAQGLISFEEPQHGFEAVILSPEVKAQCESIVQEHHRREDLSAYGLKPRHRILLHGTPGNGKTMLAEALAYELQIPYLRIKYSSLVDSFLGATAKNIDTILDYAKTAPCLLFLDEFDGIGMDRNDNKDVGEMRRITNQLLISLERLPSSCVFVGATNAMKLIDPALKRRFDFVMEISAPNSDLILQCARKELDPTLTPGHNILWLTDKIAEMQLPNLYEVVELCKQLRRDLVLNQGKGLRTIVNCIAV